MIVCVDAGARPAAVELSDPEDCGRFHLEVLGGDEAAVGEALATSGIGTLVDRDTAVISVEAVRRMARGRVGDDWSDRFSSMLAYARRKGWVTDDGAGIRAHCEWP